MPANCGFSGVYPPSSRTTTGVDDAGHTGGDAMRREIGAAPDGFASAAGG